MAQMRDSIDFSSENIGELFRKVLYPTLLGMIAAVSYTIADGIFVGQGVGSDALAAINIAAPLFLVSSGLALMFGFGGSVVASIHLANGKEKTARIVTTQAMIAAAISQLLISALALIFPEQTLRLFGCSPTLMPLAKDYLWGYVPFLAFNGLLIAGEFFVRLSGAPKFAMASSITASALNVFLDWLFIFPLGWGIWGAAIATGIGTVVGMVMNIAYLSKSSHNLHFVRFKLTRTGLSLTFRNVGYMCRLGVSSLISELSVACLMMCGNFVFARLCGDSGVAAFSVVCYLFPVVFMINNSMGQAAQPIISYNYGLQRGDKTRAALNVSMKTALVYGVVIVLCSLLGAEWVVRMFLIPSDAAYPIAVDGLRLFSAGFIPFAVNVIAMSYFQSVERAKAATVVTLLRSFVFMIAAFIILPHFLGVRGAWLAVPTSEILTMLIVLLIFWKFPSKGVTEGVN